MVWSEILEHQDVLEGFRRAVARGRLASTFLFVGPEGVGKRTFAVALAQALLCEASSESELEACGECSSCQQVRAGTHADLELVSKPDDKAYIPLEVFIGDKDHRNREGLCHRIALKPMRGDRKIAIIDDADYLNVEGANCLLKTLEEPPPRSVIVLIGSSLQRQLPTIRSRCQIIRFQPLSRESVAQLLIREQLVESEEEARMLAEVSGGSVQGALRSSDPQLREFRARLVDALAGDVTDSVALAKEVVQFVDAAGKDAPPRRARLRQVANWAAEYFSQAMREHAADAVAAEQDAIRAERCLAVVHQVNANANLTSVVEAWIDDLAHCHV